jgi:two-component SAPR family response regulator
LNTVFISKERLFEKYSFDIVFWIVKYSEKFSGIYNSYENFLKEMDELVPDLFYVELSSKGEMDINMTQLIREQFPRSDIVILSDGKNYAYEAFEREILDYLVYPIQKQRYEKTIGKLANKNTRINISKE